MKNVVHQKPYPMAELFGIRVGSVDNGSAELHVSPQEKFFNPMQRLHGGFAATVIDSALGHAVGSKVPDGSLFGTIDLKVTYVRKLDMGSGEMKCVASVLHSGRTVLTGEAKLFDASGALCAHGTATFMVYPK